MVRRNVSGPFRARSLGAGVWHLTQDTPSAAEIYLQGAGPEASEVLQGVSIAMLGVEWHGGGVKGALTVAGGVGRQGGAGGGRRRSISDDRKRDHSRTEGTPLREFASGKLRYRRKTVL